MAQLLLVQSFLSFVLFSSSDFLSSVLFCPVYFSLSSPLLLSHLLTSLLSTPHHITPHHTTLHYTTLHYTTLHFTTLHYTPLHSPHHHSQHAYLNTAMNPMVVLWWTLAGLADSWAKHTPNRYTCRHNKSRNTCKILNKKEKSEK